MILFNKLVSFRPFLCSISKLTMYNRWKSERDIKIIIDIKVIIVSMNTTLTYVLSH